VRSDRTDIVLAHSIQGSNQLLGSARRSFQASRRWRSVSVFSARPPTTIAPVMSPFFRSAPQTLSIDGASSPAFVRSAAGSVEATPMATIEPPSSFG
jgi:hypothetical protein